MKSKLEKIIAESLAIEAEAAKEAGALAFMARPLTQATLPHRRQTSNTFERRNGAFSLTITAHPRFGLPYGSYPRLILAWLTTEAVRTRSPELELGPTFSGFMVDLGLKPTGGQRGTIPSFQDQIKRLFTSSIWCVYSTETETETLNLQIAEHSHLWWEPQASKEIGEWQATVTLGSKFFNEILAHPIPIDRRALRVIKKSPMAIDIYCWMTYRMSYLRKQAMIPWEVLQMQFGADYQSNQQGHRNFKKHFIKHLRTVQALYPNANAEATASGLKLHPGPTHVTHKPPGIYESYLRRIATA